MKISKASIQKKTNGEAKNEENININENWEESYGEVI